MDNNENNVINNSNNTEAYNNSYGESVNNQSEQISQVNNMNKSINHVNVESFNTNETNNVINQNSISVNSKKEENILNKLVDFIKDNKKICLIVIGILVLLIILIKVFTSNNKTDALMDTFSISKPIPIEVNKKYGFINTNGKNIIEPIFLEASSFYGDYSIVKLEDGSYNLINEKGNALGEKGFISKPNYIGEYGVWLIDYKLFDMKLNQITGDNDVVSYESDGYFRFKNNNENNAGIMNYKGKKIYTYKFNSGEDYFSFDVSKISDSNIKEHYCRAEVENEKYAIVNCDNGKVVYDYTIEYLSEDGNNLFYISKYSSGKGLDGDYLGRVYLYPKNNNIVYYSTIDEDVSYISGGYLKIADKEYNYKYYDINSSKTLDSLDENLSYDIDKLISFNDYKLYYENGNYGIKKNDNIVYNASCKEIGFVNERLFEYMNKSKGIDLGYCIKDEKVILLNMKDGKEIEKFDNSRAVNEVMGSTFLKITTTGGTIVYNLVSNAQIKFSSYDNFNVYENYVIYKKDGKRHYYNYKLEEIYTI